MILSNIFQLPVGFGTLAASNEIAGTLGSHMAGIQNGGAKQPKCFPDPLPEPFYTLLTSGARSRICSTHKNHWVGLRENGSMVSPWFGQGVDHKKYWIMGYTSNFNGFVLV
jgi:hypothetical protein